MFLFSSFPQLQPIWGETTDKRMICDQKPGKQWQTGRKTAGILTKTNKTTNLTPNRLHFAPN